MKNINNIFTVLTLSVLSTAANADFVTDCPKNTCNNITINVTSGNYFEDELAKITGKSKIIIGEGGSISDNKKKIFMNDSQLLISTSGGITGKANIWVQGKAKAILNVANSMDGGSYTSKENGELDLNAAHAISGGKLLLDGNAMVNINSTDAITGVSGSNLRFKGSSTLNLYSENSLYNTTIQLEGNSTVNIHTHNALNYTDKISSKNATTIVDLQGYSISIGDLQGAGQIKNSAAIDSYLYTGLSNSVVLAGHTYSYSDVLKNSVVRSDAVISSALADITRQAVLTMLPHFSDRVVPEPDGIALNSQGVWLRTIYDSEKRQGDGITDPSWNGSNRGLQGGFDLWPVSEDASNKFGIYFSWLDSKSDIIGKSVYRNNDNLGFYNFHMYGGGVYNRYITSQGWYMYTVLQYAAYTGNAQQNTSSDQAKIKGHSLLASAELGYPISLNESFTLLPIFSMDYQRVNMQNYHFEKMKVHNRMDNLLRTTVGVKLYYNLMTLSGVQWSPFLDIIFNSQLAARDKVNVHVIDSGYQRSLLTTWANSEVKLGTGITVRVADNLHYYIMADVKKPLKYNSSNAWNGTAGLIFYW